MSLSNTATPYYYGLFRDAVLRGDIPVCKEISMQMNRIDERIENPNFYYDADAIDGFVDYCESEMTLTDGSDLFLLPTFKLWAEDLLSWFYFTERSVYEPYEDMHGGHYVNKIVRRRLTNKQFLIVSRGSAKSMYGSCIQSYGLNVDPETTVQITIAPTVSQADEVMGPIRTAITRARGPWFKFLTEGDFRNTRGSKANRQKLVSTKKGIENFLTGSIIQVNPWSVDKAQGARPKYTTIDEWLSCDIRENIIGAYEQGATKVEDYIMVCMSSEGTVRNSVGDTIKMELMDILKGDYNNPHVSIWYYRLDDVSEVAHPEMWMKAAPNLGKTVSYEVYQRDVERAEKVPSTRNDILAKRFGIPMEGYTYFFTYDETKPHRPRDFWRMPCAMGVDLSQGDDFCAFTFLFPISGREEYGVKTRCYVSSDTMTKLTQAARLKYEEFLREGSLVVMDCVSLDMDEVYDDLDGFLARVEYDVLTVGYDPYNAKHFIERWATENGPFGVEKVQQGVKTETVPLGELKKLAENRRLLFDESLMSFCMGNAITLEDTNGNRKLYKKRHQDKIDSVAAMMDAYVAYKLNREMFE